MRDNPDQTNTTSAQGTSNEEYFHMTPVPGPPPPPPPQVPPPPPPPGILHVETKTLESGQTETKQVAENEFLKEIKELVKLSRDILGEREGGDNDKVILVVAMPLKTVFLQNGPMCGIVALSEALEILHDRRIMEGSDHAAIEVVCPKTILDEATRKGFTKQGEMFSVQGMLTLADQFGACKDLSKILKLSKDQHGVFSDNIRKSFEETMIHLLNGHPALFPYDADHNHTPSIRKGHAAHWAVVHGIACLVPYHHLCSIMTLTVDSKKSSLMLASSYKVLDSSPECFILKPSAASDESSVFSTSTATSPAGDGISNEDDPMKLLARLFTYENTHVISHQGKSFRTALWKFADLLESNQNLKEVAPKILAQKEDFVLHEGIEDGLCSQILLLK